MELIEQTDREERIKEAASDMPPELRAGSRSRARFLVEFAKQLFSREVWEEVAESRNHDHHIPLETLTSVGQRTPGQQTQE